MTAVSQGERLAALNQALEGMADNIELQIKAVEDRLIARIASASDHILAKLNETVRRVDDLDRFRASVCDENGTVDGRAVMNRLAKNERNIGTFQMIANMGRGAIITVGFLGLIAAKGLWEGLEWAIKMLKP